MSSGCENGRNCRFAFRGRRRLLAGLAVLTALTTATAYDIEWHTTDGGGAMESSGGSYTVSGTVGQPDARSLPMNGGSYSLRSGFWVIPQCPDVRADYDKDCDVDHADYLLFVGCASGPEVSYTGDCVSRDFDSDLDVDQTDFASFQMCVSGQDRPADPGCTD